MRERLKNVIFASSNSISLLLKTYNVKRHRTSLKDLADELGVSIATVSRALRNSHEVGEEMREKVKDLAKKRNYRPNPFAQSLRNEREKLAIDNFISMHVEGIIACLAQDTVDYSHFIEIHDMGIPLVFFARTCLPEMFSQVVANGDEAAYEATMHLIEKGSKRVAFVGGPSHLDMVTRRKHGYLEALREHRMPIDRDIIVCDKIDFDIARNNTIKLLQSDNPPDAILAFNDILTLGAFDAIKSLNLRIPQDVAIIGFTEGNTAEFTSPKLSAIMDQAREQGVKACELLLRNIAGDTKIYREVVPMILKIRESSDKSLVP